jgi:methylamine dehydrogenase accessory protein MauD
MTNATLALLSGFTLVQGAAIVMAMREVARMHLRYGSPFGARIINVGPAIGEAVPEVRVVDLDGVPWFIGGQRARPLLALFMQTRCPPCRRLAPFLPAFAAAYGSEIDVVALLSLAREDRRQSPTDAMLRKWRNTAHLERVPCAVDPRANDVLGIKHFPFAVLIDASGRVKCKGIVNNGDQLESLVDFTPPSTTAIADGVSWT